MHVYLNIYIYTHISTGIYMYLNVHKRIRIHTLMHMHIYMHTHTQDVERVDESAKSKPVRNTYMLHLCTYTYLYVSKFTPIHVYVIILCVYEHVNRCTQNLVCLKGMFSPYRCICTHTFTCTFELLQQKEIIFFITLKNKVCHL
jgi:hypothetical protein